MAIGMSNEGFRWVYGINEGLMKGATSQVMGLPLYKKEMRSERREGWEGRDSEQTDGVGEKRVEV